MTILSLRILSRKLCDYPLREEIYGLVNKQNKKNFLKKSLFGFLT